MSRGGGRGKVAGIPLQLEVLVMGCQGSGKSVLVRRIKQLCGKRVPEEILDTQPTLGVELDDVVYEGASIRLREVGGSFVQVWPNFFEDCGAWAYVVDVSDELALPAAAIELWEVLNHPKMSGKRCLVVCNKTDAPLTVSDEAVYDALGLKELEKFSRVSVMRASAQMSDGITDVLGFFADACRRQAGVL